MTGLDRCYDGTAESAARIRYLYNVLLSNPQGFWEAWGESLDRMNLQPAEQSLYELTGQTAVVPDFAELHELIERRAMEQKGGNDGQ